MHELWAEMDRRQLIGLGAAGLAALVLPGAAAAMMAQGFTHGVASGEPSAHSVLLWTRYAASSDTKLIAEMSDTPDFRRISAGGEVAATGERDHVAVFGADYATPDGTGVRDYIHVSDLADAHVHALEALIASPDENLTLNCGYGRGYSVLEVLDAVDRATDRFLQSCALFLRQYAVRLVQCLWSRRGAQGHRSRPTCRRLSLRI